MFRINPLQLLLKSRSNQNPNHGNYLVNTGFFYFLITLVFCFQLLIPGLNFYRWDTLLYTWPLLAEAQEQLLSGNLPFWAPSVCCGTDLAANINLGLFYPFRILTIFLPIGAGYSIMLFIHVWLALWGMHILIHRVCKLSVLAAFIGALAYAASGYSRAMWDSVNFTALPWIPLGMAAVLIAKNHGNRVTSTLCITGCMSMMILGGDFQTAFMWVPATFLLILFMPDRKTISGTFVAGILLALLICAPQLLITYKASLLSYRAGGFSFADATERSFHPLRLIELIIPHAFGSHDDWFAPSLFGINATRLSPWIGSFHIGTLSLLPVVLAWRKRSMPIVRWASVTLVISLVLSFGRFTPLFRFWNLIPVIQGFRYPEKYLLWSTFCLAILAAFGGQTLHVLWKKNDYFKYRCHAMLWWFSAVFIGYITGFALVNSICGHNAVTNSWLYGRAIGFAILCLSVLLCTRLSKHNRSISLPVIIFLVSAIFPWYTENPLTWQWNPMRPVPVASVIRNSPAPLGRVISDNAIKASPLPAYAARFNSSVREACVLPSRMAYNSARIWGLRTADGFSPLEAGIMQKLRTSKALPHDNETSIEDFASFCKYSSAQWILTDEKRSSQLMDILPGCKELHSWGSSNKTVLIFRPDIKEAVFIGQSIPAVDNVSPEVLGIWRLRPNTIRIDLTPGGRPRILSVSETFSPGWKACDESENSLEIFPLNGAFIGLRVPAGTTQVRLKYVPQGWMAGLLLCGSGLCLLLILLAVKLYPNRIRILHSSSLPVIIAALTFALLGIAARNHWACTYDEGFHLARGMGRLLKSDSRLSYYHPPLQNLTCAYFANLAYGDKIRFPVSSGWQTGDIQRFATEFAFSNKEIFPGLVRASRWGSMIFGLILCTTGVYWSFRAGGLLAAWIAAFGFACNPNILTHSHLTTTDMGVTAIVFAASFCAWLYARSGRLNLLMICGGLFALSSLLKFTGLIWTVAFLMLSLPAFCIQKKSMKPLLVLPVTIATFLAFLLLSYGIDIQNIRIEQPEWLAGSGCIAGRYVEGLFRQGSHILSGHRAYFAGEQFYQSSWFHMPLTLLVKHPAVWSITAIAGIAFLAVQYRRKVGMWIPFLPLVVFCIMFITTNKLALGIRHILPVIPFLILAAAVFTGLIKSHITKGALSFILLTISYVTVIQSYPQFLSYYPLWAGGLDKGHYWAVDSNYDWGQNIEDIERKWAATTVANAGVPPHLLYFGFVDPRIIYGLRVAEPSWCGYMDWYQRSQGPAIELNDWISSLQKIKGTTVSSISMLKLNPFNTDLSYIENGQLMGRLNYSFFVYTSDKKDFTNEPN